MLRLLFLSYLFFTFLLFGQKKHSVETNVFLGKNIKITEPNNFHFSAQGVQFKHIRHFSKEKNWQQYYNIPKTGQELLFTNYSRNGYSIAINTFIEFNFLRSPKHDLFISPALGVTYTSVTSQHLENYKLISLPINFSIKMALGYRYAISSRWKLSTSYFVSHFSNGNISNPNHGLNLQAGKMGLNYSYGENYRPTYSIYKKEQYKLLFLQVSVGGGLKNEDNNTYFFTNGYVNTGIHFHPYHRLITGVVLLSNTPMQKTHIQTGVSLGYQIRFGKLNLSLQHGWFLKRMSKEQRFYLFAMQYYFQPNIFIMTNLRTSQKFFSEDLSLGVGFEIK